MECLVFYKAQEQSCRELKELIRLRENTQAAYRNIDSIRDFKALFRALPPSLPLVVNGDDGCLSEFINKIEGIRFENPLFYFPSGYNMDFFLNLHPERRLGMKPQDSRIDELIYSLPVVSIKGRDFRFINGICCGMDEKAKEIKDLIHEKSGRNPGFLNPLLSLRLLNFRPCGATVTIDGISRRYRKVWMASCLRGRFLNGMRLFDSLPQEEGKLNLVLLHSCGRIRSLGSWPEICSKKAPAFGTKLECLRGDDICIHFDREIPIQVDGCTVKNIDCYRVRSGPMVSQALSASQCLM